jgi:hypothetical protein
LRSRSRPNNFLLLRSRALASLARRPSDLILSCSLRSPTYKVQSPVDAVKVKLKQVASASQAALQASRVTPVLVSTLVPTKSVRQVAEAPQW